MQTLTNWVGVCVFFISLCVSVCVSVWVCNCLQCVCVSLVVCVCPSVCLVCLLSVCGLSCVALAHINVAQTLEKHNWLFDLASALVTIYTVFLATPPLCAVYNGVAFFCTACWFLCLAEKRRTLLYLLTTHVWLTISLSLPGHALLLHSHPANSLSLSFTCCTCSEDSAAHSLSLSLSYSAPTRVCCARVCGSR